MVAVHHRRTWSDLPPRCAHQALVAFRVVDVRNPDEIGELGHIPGAELVPCGTVEVASSHWRQDEPLLIVCRSGKRAARACDWLVGRGFTRVFNLEGGMLRWNEEGLPVTFGGPAEEAFGKEKQR